MTQALSRDATFGEIIDNHLFHHGYNEVLAGAPHCAINGWYDAELQAYERGRQFAALVKASGESPPPLIGRDGRPHPRAFNLLLTAMRSGDVL